ncbi:MAG: SUMF1/EgtB/PvdO family nonheme iron enzyme, partial [Lentisphaeria bacterium]|nr:SUMF1/EgtB/PvdO family nonheme iron enzyme [Lentisphaeria bacterium]
CSDYIPSTLGNLFRQGQHFTPAEAVAITRELAAGLQVMHNAGLIHRDIKPDNIIFVNGRAKLSDPGLVIRLGEEASFAGTPGFIPPELLKDGGSIDQQADIYALGKVFYCLATGQEPKLYPQLPDSMRTEVCRQIYPALIKMCNNKPAKRCKNVEELLEVLPVKFEDPTWLERWREDFRSWKQLNERKYKYCKLAVIALLMIMSCAVGVLLYQQYHDNCQQKLVLKALNEFNAINKDRQELVLLQLETALPEKVAEYKRLKANLDAAVKKRNYRAIAAELKKIREFLKSCAVLLIPELSATAENMAAGEAAAGKMHGFIAAPLAEYLPAEQRTDLRKQLKNFERILYREWNGLRCGNDLENVQYYYMPLKFMPPGAVKMYHSGKTALIPYHFWIGKNEVTGGDFANRIGISPQFAAGVNHPLERVSWNDVLYYCYKLTLTLKSYGMLPDNYIVRPPTEIEWEYAANNGWLGKDTTPLSERASVAENSQKRSWPAGRMLPNKLGLNDIYGNVSEMVQP